MAIGVSRDSFMGCLDRPRLRTCPVCCLRIGLSVTAGVCFRTSSERDSDSENAAGSQTLDGTDADDVAEAGGAQ